MVFSEWTTIGVLQYTGADTEGCSVVGTHSHTQYVPVTAQRVQVVVSVLFNFCKYLICKHFLHLRTSLPLMYIACKILFLEVVEFQF